MTSGRASGGAAASALTQTSGLRVADNVAQNSACNTAVNCCENGDLGEGGGNSSPRAYGAKRTKAYATLSGEYFNIIQKIEWSEPTFVTF